MSSFQCPCAAGCPEQPEWLTAGTPSKHIQMVRHEEGAGLGEIYTYVSNVKCESDDNCCRAEKCSDEASGTVCTLSALCPDQYCLRADRFVTSTHDSCIAVFCTSLQLDCLPCHAPHFLHSAWMDGCTYVPINASMQKNASIAVSSNA